jgi:hypothetical protein
MHTLCSEFLPGRIETARARRTDKSARGGPIRILLSYARLIRSPYAPCEYQLFTWM